MCPCYLKNRFIDLDVQAQKRGLISLLVVDIIWKKILSITTGEIGVLGENVVARLKGRSFRIDSLFEVLVLQKVQDIVFSWMVVVILANSCEKETKNYVKR